MSRYLVPFALLLMLATRAHAIDIEKLTRDTQRISQSSNDVTLVWWMPRAFWEASIANSPGLTAEGRASMLAVLDEYSVFALLRARAGALGDMEAPSREDVIAHARFEVDGAAVEPVAPKDLSPGIQVLLAGLKPGLANMLGKLGQNMQLVVYPNRRDGRALVDATKPGTLQFTLYDKTFKWRLPLPSLLPVKVDPKTGDEFPGDFSFNPYTGAPLSER